MTTYTLPWPPSVNRVWMRSRKGGVYLSKRAAKFRTDVYADVLEQGRKHHKGKVSVCMSVQPPNDHRKHDLDNLAKATLDALTAAGVWSDDSQIDDLRIVRGECVKGGKMVVEIREIT